MDTPRILDSSGMPVVKAEMRTGESVNVSSGFDPQTGLGLLTLETPAPGELELLAAGIVDAIMNDTEGERVLMVHQLLLTHLRNQRVALMPQEAMVLGARLIQEAEAAIGQAALVRFFLANNYSLPDAMKSAQEVVGVTRADHKMAYARRLQSLQKAKQEQNQHELMQEKSNGRVS